MFRNRLLNSAFLMTSLVLSAPSLANTFETTLDNGLKIIVKEDKRAPSVVHMVWYGIGSMDEPEGGTGIAHILEHMMFKGTEKIAPGEFNTRVAAVGGSDNAFTSYDYTAYFQQIPPTHLAEMMMLEADRMANLKITNEHFLPELEVIKEERRMRVDDNPQSLVYEQLLATAFQAHPYHHPIIGWMPDIVATTVEDAQRWHQQWYAPNNAKLVVVGNVDHQDVFKLAQQHFGVIASRELPRIKISQEPAQRGPRHTVVRAPSELPYLVMAWHAPSLRDPANDRDSYALQMLANVLSGSDAARLPRHLVREQKLAVASDASYSPISRGPSLFMMDATPAAGRSIAEVEAALRAQIAFIQEKGITEEELQRVRTRAIAGKVYKRDSLMGQAMEIGFLESNGLGWRDDEVILEGLRSVTAAEVQDVARRYFNDNNLTRAELVPLPLDKADKSSSLFGAQRPHLF